VGMRMVNTEGPVFYAVKSEMLGDDPRCVKAGEVKTTRFEFGTASLSPGEYFFSAGLVEGGSIGEFSHRRIDFVHLKVVSSEIQRHVGLVDLDARLTVS